MYVMKAFAIFSVICAHMKFQLEYGSAGWLSDKIISILGIFGVPVFYICAGYYYRRAENDTYAFWSKKLKNIMIPWLIWAAFTNILNNVIQYSNISIKGFIKWFSGYHSLYYFLAVLVFCFVIFKPYRNKKYMIVIGLISITVNILVALNFGGVLHSKILSSYFINYLVWPIFFEMGILWRLYEVKLRVLMLGDRKVWCGGIIISFIIVYLTLVISDTRVSYWGYYSVIFELLGFLTIFMLSRKVYYFRVLEYIGQNTFFIYLTHMQIVGVINTRLPQNGFFYLIKPFIGLMVMCCLVFFIQKILAMLKWKWLAPYIGIKL